MVGVFGKTKKELSIEAKKVPQGVQGVLEKVSHLIMIKWALGMWKDLP